MMLKACWLALRDYCHEGLLSACAVLSLAAVLAPLLVLYGVKHGVVQTMTERLRNDPRNLEISPIASGYFTADMLAALGARADVDFILPRTRSIAATIDLSSAQAPQEGVPRITVSMEPSAYGDPLIARHVPASIQADTPETFGILLSASAARKLNANAGDVLTARVERRASGRIEAAYTAVRVLAVLPLEAQQKDVAFVPLPLLEATEDFRDARVPAPDPRLSLENGWKGEPRPHEPRMYPGFRLYAKKLEDVAVLRDYLTAQRIEVYTHAEDIAAVQRLDTSLTLIFGLIGAAAGIGFMASSASNALASVRRKERYLGILRLVGYSARAIMVFSLFQGLLTALCGTVLAVALYAGAALVIDNVFAHSLHGVERICTLPPEDFGLALALVVSLTLLAAAQPAARAARVEPSEVIRDV